MASRQRLLLHSLTRTTLVLRGSDVEFWRNHIPPSLKQNDLIMETEICLETLVPLCQITLPSYNTVTIRHRSENFTVYNSDVAVKLGQSATDLATDRRVWESNVTERTQLFSSPKPTNPALRPE